MLKFKSLLLFLLSLILCWSTAFGAKRGIRKVEIKTKSGETVGLYAESHALVIGASNYTNGWPKLPGVIDDVYAVRDALEMHGFIVHIVEDPADYNALDDAFTSFISKYGRKPDNRLLFYFSGHGHTEKNYGEEMGYIVPTVSPNPNRDLDGFLDTAMDMQQIEVYAKRIRSKHALFLFDSCFSGSLFALSRAIPENISYKTAKPVRQFITSGSAEEEVPDTSIFRRQFVAALNGEGDTDGDRYITAIELGEFLQKSVVNYSRNAQHPQYGKIRNPNLDKGDFVFALSKSLQKKDSTIAKIAPATSAFLPDEEMWREVKSSKDAEDFEDFLAAFPNSKLAPVAMLKLKRLKRKQPETKTEQKQIVKGVLFGSEVGTDNVKWFVEGDEKKSDKYIGEIVNGKPNGKGTVNDLSGNKGNKYVGEWKSGKYYGQGTLTYSDGSKYVGEFKDGEFHGQGTYTFSDARKYGGDFKDDEPNGKGTYIFPDGKKYIGEFKSWKYHGQGTYTWSDGRKYVGKFKDGKFHGQGTFTFSNKDKYVGKFKNDKFDGQGTFTLYDGQWKGDKYVGKFKEGVYHGKGTYTWSDGTKYVGEFKDGIYNGKGTLTSKDGGKFVGEWKDDKEWNGNNYNKDGNIKYKWVNGVKHK